jgi:hypothetical protein
MRALLTASAIFLFWASAGAQTVNRPIGPVIATPPGAAPPTVLVQRPMMLACPAQLRTNVLAADINPPWAAASGSVSLIGAVVRPEPGGGKRVILECSYRATPTAYATVNLWTYTQPNACVVAANQKSFACLQGTAFSRD